MHLLNYFVYKLCLLRRLPTQRQLEKLQSAVEDGWMDGHLLRNLYVFLS